MSSKYISKNDTNALSELYEVVNVAPDGNCCFYVATNYINKYKGRRYKNVDRFRMDLKKHMTDNKKRLRSKQFGLYSLWQGSVFDEQVARVYQGDKNYSEGVSEEGWASMNNIYPVLVDKFGYFKLMVFDPVAHTYLYDMNNCQRG